MSRITFGAGYSNLIRIITKGKTCGYIDLCDGVWKLVQLDSDMGYFTAPELRQIADKIDQLNAKESEE